MAISAITAVTNAAQTLGNLILATPQNTIGYQPQNTLGQPLNQPAIIFHYEGENKSRIESDITDHYIENNTPIQDHIALKPVIITTQGFVGDLNDLAPTPAFVAAQIAAEKLTVIGPYTPSLSATALLAYNEAVFGYQTIKNTANAAISAWNSVTGQAGNGTGGLPVIEGDSIVNSPATQTKQQQYYTQFYGYWANRILFTLQTPWAVFKDMAIMSIEAVQDAKTTTITDFSVVFKQIRYASVLQDTSLYSDSSNQQARLSQQTGAPGPVNNGTSSLTPSPITFASTLGTSSPSVG